jgi:ABC-2 type transport system permease protein
VRAIDLAVKDLLQLVRDRKSAIFLVALPILFTLLMGFIFGGGGSSGEDPRLPVGFVDQDPGHLSASLLALLDASDVIRPIALEGRDTDPDRVDEQVREADLAAVVIVPSGYGERLLEGEPLQLEVIADKGSTTGLTVEGEIQVAVACLAGAVQAAQLSVEAYEEEVQIRAEAVSGFADEGARDQFLLNALDQAIAAWQEPPVTVNVRQSGAVENEEDSSAMQGGFAHTSPAMMVQFAIAGLIGSGSILVLERRSGALQRLLTTAISRLEIILGHYLAMFAMILVQLTILAAFAQLALDVNYMRAPLATLLAMVATALWTASLGLLIGALAKTDDQATIFALMPMFVLAGLGGAWVPLEFTGKTFQTIGHLMPSAWSMDSFENIVIRGLGLESVLLPVGIMLAYAVVLFALAAWRFRFE